VTLETGMTALNQGRFLDAEQAFRQLIKTPENVQHVAPFLIFSLIEQNKVHDLHTLTVPSDFASTYQKAMFDALWHYIKQGRFGVIASISQHLKPDHLFLMVITQFLEACIKSQSGDTDMAAPHFKKAHALAYETNNALSLPDNIAELVKAGWNVENDAFVLAVMNDSDLDAAKANLLVEKNILPNSQIGDFVIYSSCDEKYVDAFVEDEVLSLEKRGKPQTFHLNIVGGSKASGGKIDAIRGKLKHVRLNYSIEHAPKLHSTTYFACSRFVNALTIMKLYDQDLLISDVDIVFNEHLDQVTSVMKKYDVGYYFYENAFPWLRHYATEVYVKNNTQGRSYLSSLGNYCVKKLYDHRYWTLDQAAMYCVASAFQRSGVNVSICDLLQLGATLHDVQMQMDARLVRNQTRFV